MYNQLNLYWILVRHTAKTWISHPLVFILWKAFSSSHPNYGCSLCSLFIDISKCQMTKKGVKFC
jgi:hypothetical protein